MAANGSWMLSGFFWAGKLVRVGYYFRPGYFFLLGIRIRYGTDLDFGFFMGKVSFFFVLCLGFIHAWIGSCL